MLITILLITTNRTNDMLTLSCNLNRLEKTLNELTIKLTNPAPLLFDMGTLLYKSTDKRFDTQINPEGEHWLPNHPLVILRKGQGKPPLTGLTGQLRQTINYSVVGYDLILDAPVNYAYDMQMGGLLYWSHYEEWWNVPSRKFMGISTDDFNGIMNIMNKWLTL